MMMKFVSIFLFLAISQVACSQQKDVIILKKCVTKGNNSFPDKNYICEKMSFKRQDLINKVNYSSNGWQIIDSVSYEKDGAKYCVKSYQPIYDIERRFLKEYELSSYDCDQKKLISKGYFSQIDDQFNLSKSYITDLNFLLERNPENKQEAFYFNEGIIPSLFTKYGIPYDEQLNSFKFSIQDNLLENDSFYFEQYTLKRQYLYEGHMLKEVRITIEIKNSISEYKEFFYVTD